MNAKPVFVLISVLVCMAQSLSGSPADKSPEIILSNTSIQVDGVELRSSPSQEGVRYISFAKAKSVFGPPTTQYRAIMGVLVYAWQNRGIDLQRGWRGADKGKIFKFQLFFKDSYDPEARQHSGQFTGQIRVDGIAINQTTSFASIQPELEKNGYKIPKPPQIDGTICTEKGGISIFKADAMDQIERIDVWCQAP